ncbi:MAG: hypothetical protein ACYCQJ_15535 [Nitrososphaerales archaeon]
MEIGSCKVYLNGDHLFCSCPQVSLEMRDLETKILEKETPQIRSTVSSVERVWKDSNTEITFTVDAQGEHFSVKDGQKCVQGHHKGWTIHA